jgi:hypothetical protein
VSIYLFSTAGPAASAWIYYEASHPPTKKHLEYNPHVKLGLSYFPKGLLVWPRCYGRSLGPVVFETVHKDGGHFAAHERPELLVADVRKMFGKGGGASEIARRLSSS